VTSFLVCFLYLCPYCNFYGASSVARPCSCRWANNSCCAIVSYFEIPVSKCWQHSVRVGLSKAYVLRWWGNPNADAN